MTAVFSIYMDKFILIYCCVLAVVLGAVFGSFLNCAAWRIAHGESFLKGRSHCPVCGHELGILDLFPIISYLVLGGKCRYCRTNVSVRYPLTEAFFALMTLLCLLRFDLTAECLRNYVFGCCLFCLSLVDLEEMIIPNGALIIAAVAYVLAVPFVGMTISAVLMHVLAGVVIGGSMLVISLIFDHILGRESMGGGDIKLFAVSGLYLGFAASLFALMLSCVLGLVFAAVYKAVKKNGQGPEFPFGPAIAAAVWFMLLYGSPIVSWYLRIIGI